MDTIYKINTQLDVPIYRQLVDSIQTAVKKGDLPAGYQLPTVQELTQMLCIARGTVKRAYDALERIGLVEKVQGRGTFVCYQPSNSGSRTYFTIKVALIFRNAGSQLPDTQPSRARIFKDVSIAG